jgi:hypothetical protein
MMMLVEPFRDPRHALAGSFRERVDTTHNLFQERVKQAEEVLPENFFAEADRHIAKPRHKKTELFGEQLKALERTYQGLTHFSVLAALFHIRRARKSMVRSKSKTWWHVQVWGPVLDGLLHGVVKTDIDRERASGDLSSGSARLKHPDMQLFSTATPRKLDNHVAFLQVEEKPGSAAPTNKLIKGIALGT